MKVLVTGSSGRIGGAIAARLTLRHQVTGFDQRPGPLTTATGDVRDTGLLAGLVAGMDAVVHTASLHVPDLAARSEQEFRDVNVHATRRLLQACGEAGVGRFVYTSTTSLYGDALVPDARERGLGHRGPGAQAARHLRRDQARGRGRLRAGGAVKGCAA